MNLPNKLTLMRCILTPIFLFLMLANFPFHYAAALVVFAVASLTDYFDGKIARKYNLITNLGKFLDPLADKALTTAAFLGFIVVLGGPLMCWAVFLVLAREFAVTSVRLLAAKDGVVVAASFAGKLKTVMQMVSIIYTLAALQVCDLDITTRGTNTALIVIGILLIWISVVATVVSGVQYVWALRHYFKEN
ncbi:MAG: CDP-diacylglycerol--glycerol-3-phosphate 3-phosphatidyltransferase [Clostridia bacterium]|nr:CDP-diacylglycerol--glycerol-3-phosphate 3-phosphatidyltransferase [Clostridia bacterium]